MTDQSDIAEKFWEKLKSDRTIMLGLSAQPADEAQPMTAILEDDEPGPAWIFSAKDVDLVRDMANGDAAFAQFVSKKNDLFASCRGRLTRYDDRATIERLWNPFVDSWFEGGIDDPKVQLLRFDITHAQVWLNENSLLAGVKIMFGMDPKEEYKDKVTELDYPSR